MKLWRICKCRAVKLSLKAVSELPEKNWVLRKTSSY